MRTRLGLIGLATVTTMGLATACSSGLPNDNADGGAGTGGTSGTGGTGASAGAAGTAGTAGTGGSSAICPNGDCGVIRSGQVDKVDLLFMIDNSASMYDKQEVLSAAVPDLVEKLVFPACKDMNGNTQDPDSTNTCPSGFQHVFQPISNIHIGVVTSSLGGHGANICNTEDPTGGYAMDMSHLSDRNGKGGTVPTYVTPDGRTSHFLYWGTDTGAETNYTNLITNFTTIVTGVGQNGCGFESSLEGWYRFLVDPQPYQSIAQGPCPGNPGVTCANTSGIDSTVLQERADFLRQDSLLAVVMLSDENDCSIIDGSQNYLVLQDPGTFPMFKGTAACATNPMSDDCKPCLLAPSDSNCSPTNYGGKSDPLDPYNLRCLRQKQRFGMDFMWPVSRYVTGLTSPLYKNSDGSVDHVNPLYCVDQAADGKSCNQVMRDHSQVLFAGIIGVPWQDIAAVPTNNADATWWHHDDTGYTLSYLSTSQFGYKTADYQAAGLAVPAWVNDKATVWDLILGGTTAAGEIDYSPSAEPFDPLMVESVAPRIGNNPVTGQALGGTEATIPWTNEINGHEWDVGSAQNDLQYACIFDLETPYDGSTNGDCGFAGLGAEKTPLCQNDDGSYGTTQYRAKGYPGRRELAVLKGVGDQAIVGSICPKSHDSTRADYGYRPAIGAITGRLSSAITPTCLSKALATDANGMLNCTVLEATKAPLDDTCTCAGQARSVPTAGALAILQADPDYIQNGMGCACVVEQVGTNGNGGTTEHQACLVAPVNTVPPDVYGWCLVDSDHNPAVVISCPPGEKQLIRFAGAPPANGSLTFLQCQQ